MINKQKLDKTMTNLGFAERHAGTAALREAVTIMVKSPGMALTKELYPALAAASGSDNWRRIERNMRHAIGRAYDSAGWQWDLFMGKVPPRNGEVIIRLARACSE